MEVFLNFSRPRPVILLHLTSLQKGTKRSIDGIFFFFNCSFKLTTHIFLLLTFISSFSFILVVAMCTVDRSSRCTNSELVDLTFSSFFQ